jgi:hypothetical protein
LNPKDDTQNPGGITPLSGSAIADEPTQPIEPETPISEPTVGIPTSAPKVAPSVPSISQDEPLGETTGIGGSPSTVSTQVEPLTGGMGSGIGTVTPKATIPVADEPMGVKEPEETTEEPEISPLVEPEKTSTEDTGTGGVSGL